MLYGFKNTGGRGNFFSVPYFSTRFIKLPKTVAKKTNLFWQNYVRRVLAADADA
jgi:hypothetical protein